jgi:hypothetical protein
MADAWDALRTAIPGARDDARRLALLRSYADTCDPRDAANSYQYESRATAIATRWPELLALCDQVARAGDGETEKFRFLCVAVAFNGYRRERRFNLARAVLDSVEALHGQIPLFAHFRAMSVQGQGTDGLRNGLEWADRARHLLPDNPGVTHTSAVLIADLADSGGLQDEDNVEISRGLEFAKEAIRAFPDHGRFYHTRARLRRLSRDYDGARSDLARAIDMESREDVDSRERIATYVIERSLVDSDQAIRRMITRAEAKSDALTTRTEELQRSLAGSQIQIVEVIGFVAAVMGLVLLTGTAFAGRDLSESLTLLAGLALVLFSAVAIGSWMLRRSSR